MIPRVTASIDLDAIRHNLTRIRQWAPDSRVMAVIKADAYGHGAVQVARALRDLRSESDFAARHPWEADAFAVACLEEALRLREARVYAPIVVLEGVLSLEELRLCLHHELQIVVHDDWQLALLEQLPRGARARLWIKIDTGMHRLGFEAEKIAAVHERILVRRDWQLCGWMTHLARADETDSAATQAQIDCFDAVLADRPGARTIANSAGLVAWPQARVDWVRPGLLLYGASPLPGRTGAELGLRPAMRLDSRVLALRDCRAGEPIGYGAIYHCERDMRIAVVTVGYADGVLRCLPNGTPFQVHGQSAPMVGRVSMDMVTIDVSAIPQTRVGDSVLLWGEGLPVEALAERAGTLSYELFCGLTQRVRRVYP